MKAFQPDKVRSVLTALQAATYARLPDGLNAAEPRFLTISRQAGAGGKTLGIELANELNRLDPGHTPWTVWDHELVDKVSAEHHIPADVVEAVENAEHSWFREFVEALTVSESHSELKVYHRIALVIRALARTGRVIMVGRGSAFVTAGIPGGVHLRLIAPLDFRIQRIAERYHVSREQAAIFVQETDRARAAFFRRYWPAKDLGPEQFTVTFNTARLSDVQMVASVVPLLNDRTPATSSAIS